MVAILIYYIQSSVSVLEVDFLFSFLFSFTFSDLDLFCYDHDVVSNDLFFLSSPLSLFLSSSSYLPLLPIFAIFLMGSVWWAMSLIIGFIVL